MEIEIKPISIDARLEYLQHISENQEINTTKFPWAIAIGAFIVGGGTLYLIMYYYKKQNTKEEN